MTTDTDGPTRDGMYRDNLPETGQIAGAHILMFFGEELRRELNRRREATPPAPAEATR